MCHLEKEMLCLQLFISHFISKTHSGVYSVYVTALNGTVIILVETQSVLTFEQRILQEGKVLQFFNVKNCKVLIFRNSAHMIPKQCLVQPNTYAY